MKNLNSSIFLKFLDIYGLEVDIIYKCPEWIRLYNELETNHSKIVSIRCYLIINNTIINYLYFDEFNNLADEDNRVVEVE